jgi:hypothetical protein
MKMKTGDNKKTIAGRISATCNEHMQQIIDTLYHYDFIVSAASSLSYYVHQHFLDFEIL